MTGSDVTGPFRGRAFKPLSASRWMAPGSGQMSDVPLGAVFSSYDVLLGGGALSKGDALPPGVNLLDVRGDGLYGTGGVLWRVLVGLPAPGATIFVGASSVLPAIACLEATRGKNGAEPQAPPRISLPPRDDSSATGAREPRTPQPVEDRPEYP